MSEAGSVIASSAPRVLVETEHDDGLNERQREFVGYYCAGVPKSLLGLDEDVGPGDGYHSALAAGYSETSAASMGTRNLLKPKVQAEIERRVKSGRGSALLTGTTALRRIIEKGSDERAIVTAAVALLDRFGMAAPKGPAVAVQINNIGGNEAQAILLDVQRAREERLAKAKQAALPDAGKEFFD